MKKRRNRSKPNSTLNERLTEFGARLYAEAGKAPPGSEEQDALIKRARRAEIAIRLNDSFSYAASSAQIRSHPE